MAIATTSVLLLSWVALYNTSPLVFSDSIAYATAALRGEVPGLFSVFYSYLILPFHGGLSLWPVIFVQAALISHLLFLVLRYVSEGALTRVSYLLAIALLSVCSSLPWIVGQIMPDVFTPVLVLGIFLLGFCAADLSRTELVYISALTATAISTHLSHVPIAAGLALTCLFLSSDFRLTVSGVGRWIALIVVPLAFAIGAMLAVNWSTSGQLKLARNSNVFLLAKWIDEGPALSYLENNCPEAGHALCEYVAELKGLTHDDLKWGGNSPFHKLGGFDALEPEAAAIVRQTFFAHPLEIVWRAILDTGRQMTRFGAGDGLSSSYAKLVAPHLKELYDPAVERALLSSKQANGNLSIQEFRSVHLIVLAASFLFCAMSFFTWRRALPNKLVMLFLFVPIAIVWNAAITGGLSGAYDRYLARVIWIIPFVALITVTCLVREQVRSGGGSFNSATAEPPTGTVAP